MDNGRRHVPGFPAQKPRAHPQIGIVPEGEEFLVKAPGLFEDFSVIESGARIWPEGLFRPFELTDIRRLASAPAILAIPVNQMAHLIDDVSRILEQDLAGEHSDPRVELTIAHHFR